MSKCDDKKKKKGKGVISLFVFTPFCVEDCNDKINQCLDEISLPRTKLIVITRRSNSLRIIGSEKKPFILVFGGHGGSQASGMNDLCVCLEKTGFVVQAVPSCLSFFPEIVET